MLYGFRSHTEIGWKLIIICITIFLMTSYESHQYLKLFSNNHPSLTGNVLGLDGMQLFIDAGIPVNRGLISALVKDVISERLDILFGYPKEAKQETQPEVQPPEERPPSVVSTPLATPVYTPPESDASGLKTPSASASASELSDESLGQPRFDETVVPEEKDEEPSEQGMLSVLFSRFH